jgi:hypothetical protein
MADRNEYPDGTEIHNRDDVTIQVSGIVYRRILYTFEELNRQLQGRIDQIGTPEEKFDQFRKSDIFKDYDDERLRELAAHQVEEHRAALYYMLEYSEAERREMHSKDAITVKPDPEPNRMW